MSEKIFFGQWSTITEPRWIFGEKRLRGDTHGVKESDIFLLPKIDCRHEEVDPRGYRGPSGFGPACTRCGWPMKVTKIEYEPLPEGVEP